MFGAVDVDDIPDDPSHIGSKGGGRVQSCHVPRQVLEKRMSWGPPARVARFDFARAYEIIHHSTLTAMTRRGVPRTFPFAHLRAAPPRSYDPSPRRMGGPAHQCRRGLVRQGCSAAPLISCTMENDGSVKGTASVSNLPC